MTKRAKSPTRAKSKATRSRASKPAPAKKKRTNAIKSRPAPHDPLDALVDAAARSLALPLDPAWRPSIKTNLAVSLGLAALFADFPLPDEAEPAPVFVA